MFTNSCCLKERSYVVKLLINQQFKIVLPKIFPFLPIISKGTSSLLKNVIPVYVTSLSERERER